jgi:hypothetical protein
MNEAAVAGGGGRAQLGVRSHVEGKSGNCPFSAHFFTRCRSDRRRDVGMTLLFAAAAADRKETQAIKRDLSHSMGHLK